MRPSGLKRGIQEVVSCLADGGREVVAAVGMLGHEPVARPQQGVDRRSGTKAIPDAGDLEVGVVLRGVHEHRARRQGGQDFREVEGHPARVLPIRAGDARHIALMAPAGQVSAAVLGERSEPATGDDGLDAPVEDGQEDRVVPPERMPDAPDARAVHARQRFQHVQGAHVVPDGLHGGAGVAAGVGVAPVLAEVGVVGAQHDIPAPGKLKSVPEVPGATQAGGFILADSRRLVQAQGGRGLAAQVGGDKQPC